MKVRWPLVRRPEIARDQRLQNIEAATADALEHVDAVIAEARDARRAIEDVQVQSKSEEII